MPNWTPEQLSAIENTEQTLLLSAAAGSGKTATLTERLIRMISREDNPLRVDRMLVATFTKAAAAQLREKIGNALGRAIEADPENAFLSEQMLLLPMAKIRTIDSFCNDLVKENTDLLGIPKTYRIPDKAESLLLSASIMQEVIEDAYSGALAKEGLDMLSLADAFTNVSNEEELASILFSLYTDLLGYKKGVALLKENALSLKEAASLPFLEAPWGLAIKNTLSSYLSELIEGYSRLYEAAFVSGAGDALFRQNYAPAAEGEIEELKTLLLSLKEGYGAAKAAFGAFGLHPVGRKRGDSAPTESDLLLKEFRTYAAAYIKEWRETFFAWEEKDIPKAFLASASITESLFVLLDEFDHRFCEEKRRRGLCDFSDLSRFALQLLLDEEGKRTPFAAELAAQYDAVCVDEYQDVNEVQHLLFEAVSTERNRFMVGDIKQSIYAFRGAQPSIFAGLRSTLPPPEEKKSAAVQYLSANFRSAAPVINFCNEAFDFLFSILGDSIGYSEKDRLCQGRKTVAPLPVPEISLLLPAEKAEGEEKENALPFECRAVAKKIAALLQNGKKEDGSPVSPSDIAILFRQGSALPARYAAALKAEGVPTLYDDKELFFRKNEILLALCLLNTVNNPRRDIYLAGLLRSPIYRFTMDDLILIRRESGKRDIPLYDALCAYTEKFPAFQKGEHFLKDLAEFRDMAEGLPSDKLLYTLYERTRLFSLVSLDEKRNLLLLYDYARRFEATAFHGLYRLIDNLNDMMDKGFSLGDGRTLGAKEGVHIMTMHHSKGLEYPFCFVVECGAKLKNDDEAPYYFDSELGVACPVRDESGYARLSTPVLAAVRALRARRGLEEELRVLYVALTRAQEGLFISASPAGRSDATVFKSAAILRATPAVSALAKFNRYIDWLLAAFGVCETGCASAFATFALIGEEPPENLDRAETPLAEENGAATESNSQEADAQVAIEAAEREAAEAAEREAEREAETAHLTALLSSRFAFTYPHEAETRLPRKLSVSRLSPAVLDTGEEGALSLDTASSSATAEEDFIPTLPRFLSGKEENAAAKAGSATHAFMQFCRFEALVPASAVADVKGAPMAASFDSAKAHPAILALRDEPLYAALNAEIDRLVAARFLDGADAARILRRDLVSFIRSPLFTLLLQCRELHRELRFHALLPASLFTQTSKEALSENTLLVQGVMDLLLRLENGELVLCDYKTDRIPADLKKDEAAFAALLSERHRPQLTYYAAAVEKIFGKRPSAVLLYSLALGKAISLSL